MTCRFCSKECKNPNSLRNHERLCKQNPNKQASMIEVYNQTKPTPWNKGLTKDDPRVAMNAENVSKAMKGKASRTVWTDEMRRSKSEWNKRYYQNHPEQHPNRLLAGNRSRMSYPEKIAFDYLTSMGVPFEHNKKIGKYYPDFIVGENVVIEIDGVRWHNKEKDQCRDSVLNEMGYAVHRIDAKEHIQNRILEILVSVGLSVA